MQQLMKIGFFGSQFHPDMVLSLTAGSFPVIHTDLHSWWYLVVSSPFRGTHIVYALGERTDAAPSVRPFSLGSVIAKTVHIFSYLSPLLPRFLDMHSEARVLSYRDASPTSLWRQLRKSDWAESYDATPYDMTFQATADREASLEGLPHPHTFYRSYCAALVGVSHVSVSLRFPDSCARRADSHNRTTHSWSLGLVLPFSVTVLFDLRCAGELRRHKFYTSLEDDRSPP